MASQSFPLGASGTERPVIVTRMEPSPWAAVAPTVVPEAMSVPPAKGSPL